jgi:hypothetical protein
MMNSGEYIYTPPRKRYSTTTSFRGAIALKYNLYQLKDPVGAHDAIAQMIEGWPRA